MLALFFLRCPLGQTWPLGPVPVLPLAMIREFQTSPGSRFSHIAGICFLLNLVDSNRRKESCMYLSDREIEALLSDLGFASADPEHPFQASEQVQPCSIDLRLSNVFWEPISGKTIDLRKARLLDLEPRLLWKRRELRKGESITLRPGRLLLGRVNERLTVPPQYAGKIEGRSSFARLGLGNVEPVEQFTLSLVRPCRIAKQVHGR